MCKLSTGEGKCSRVLLVPGQDVPGCLLLPYARTQCRLRTGEAVAHTGGLPAHPTPDPTGAARLQLLASWRLDNVASDCLHLHVALWLSLLRRVLFPPLVRVANLP